MTPGKDVVVFFSHSGNTAEAVLAAHHLINSGTCTLVVTSKTGQYMHTCVFVCPVLTASDIECTWFYILVLFQIQSCPK